ncbi:hypothetical protein VDG1235_658 [Verrucomicrobiia bacterium DG1235]|nr:hypothetical protein VDG1235_658 [Verrucomicrobiae bacterium DG1235]
MATRSCEFKIPYKGHLKCCGIPYPERRKSHFWDECLNPSEGFSESDSCFVLH